MEKTEIVVFCFLVFCPVFLGKTNERKTVKSSGKGVIAYVCVIINVPVFKLMDLYSGILCQNYKGCVISMSVDLER